MVKNMIRKPTTREIAKECGVSIATVSRVLNKNYKNGFSVRKELHDRIFEVADELGYRPNLSAQNLSCQKTNMIAFLGLNTSFGWPTNIYQPMCESATQIFQNEGYNVCTAAPNLDRDNTELPPWRVDGVVVIQECSVKTLDEMERLNIPYVVVNGVGGQSCSTVVPDDVDATKRVFKHLLDLGHKRIAYAGPSPEHRRHASIQQRHRTFLSELKEHDLELIEGHETHFASGLDYLVFSVLKQKATAIVAYDHVIAMRLIHDANLLSIEIPKHVSVICFNDEKLCDLVVPPLTSVGVPSVKMGKVAAELLLEQIESPKAKVPPIHITLQENLVIRSSTTEPYI